MKIRMLTHLGVIAALAGSMLAASVANASILTGTVSFSGLATVATNDFTPASYDASAFLPATFQIALGGNTGSFAGYNAPNNPVVLFFTLPYIGTIQPIPSVGAPGNVLALPGVANPDSPVLAPLFFQLTSWAITGNYKGEGAGTFVDGANNAMGTGFLELTAQALSGTGLGTYSGTLTATVIPVPGAIWIFGSGLLLMTAVMRRKAR